MAQQRVRYFRYVWPRAESAIYGEVKRLSSMGLLEGTKEYTGKRSRTVYSITEAGKEALREWLGTPISPFSMDFEAMLRLFVLPLGTKDDIMGTLKQVRADTHEMLEFSGKVKQEFIDGINVTQDQVYIRALVVDFFISLLNTVEAWAERTLAEIETWDDLLPSEEKNTRGLEKIRQLPVATPAESLKHIAKPLRARCGPAPETNLTWRWLLAAVIMSILRASTTGQTRHDRGGAARAGHARSRPWRCRREAKRFRRG